MFGRARSCAVVGAAACLLSSIVSVAAAAPAPARVQSLPSVAPLVSSTATAAVLPADASTSDPDPSMGQTSCPAAGICYAVGDYATGAGRRAGFVETTVAGVSTASVLPQPSGGQMVIWLISCPLTTSCMATGNFTPDDGSTERTIVEQWDGVLWTQDLMPLPPYPGNFPEPEVTSLDCLAADFCAAVGQANNVGSFLATWSSGEWTFAVVGPSSLNALSCASSTMCVAVGATSFSRGDTGLIETWNGQEWTAIDSPLPDDAAVGVNFYDAQLSAVSCSSQTVCHAGGYYDADGPQEYEGALVESLVGGTWRPHALPTVGESLDERSGQVWSLACPTDRWCAATLTDDVPGALTEVDTLSGGSWSATAVAPPDEPEEPSFPAQFGEMQCPDAGSCVIVGTFPSADFGAGAFEERLDDGIWTSVLSALPIDAASQPMVQQDVNLGCASAAACEATFSYFTVRDTYGIAVLSAPGLDVATPAFAAAALRGGEVETYLRRVAGRKGRWRGLGGHTRLAPAVVIQPPNSSGQVLPLYIDVGIDRRLRVRTLNRRWQLLASGQHCSGAPAASTIGSALVVACENTHHQLVIGQTVLSAGRVSAVRWQKFKDHALSGALAVVGAGTQTRVFVIDRSHRLLEHSMTGGYRRLATGCDGSVAAATTPSRSTTYLACRRHNGSVTEWIDRGNGWSRGLKLGGHLLSALGIAATGAGPVVFGEARSHQLRMHLPTGWSTALGKIHTGVAAVGLN
jgi:hypothetical protein